ncbi:MAG TPA: Stp1/IreP family PP2C-type Ser/Thr phosphatase [Gaiellaceae bacterium]|jgi:protein phosphatase|nr:Stp1/IreP family PP2C-type Ser/Thr phosphatase [Gaiellaceae bacterium]
MSIVQYAVASDTGKKRRRNEDNYVVAPPLFAVADGMGGAQAGEVASKLAASTLESEDDRPLHGTERVAALIAEANRRVFDRASNDPTASGMGTTMTVALVEGMTVAIGHVGDSRAYLVRAGAMEQLTEDHSLVNELLKSGKLSPEEAQTHPQRSVITRAVGTDPDVDVDAFTIDAEDGDVFLLCSDGLTDMVEDVDILELLDRWRDDLDRAVKSLVAAANRGGGEDNITAVAFRVAAGGDDETVQMPAAEPDEDTVESVEPEPAVDTMVIPPDRIEQELLEPGSPEARAAARGREPVDTAARLRLALTMVGLLGVAVVLLVWGLLR